MFVCEHPFGVFIRFGNLWKIYLNKFGSWGTFKIQWWWKPANLIKDKKPSGQASLAIWQIGKKQNKSSGFEVVRRLARFYRDKPFYILKHTDKH